MTTTQFSLFFVALVVGYVLVHLRLARCERHLREISVLKLLNERLRNVADSVERVRVDRLEEGLQLLHDDLQACKEIGQRLERGLGKVTADGGGIESGGDFSPGQRIRKAVEEQLLRQGYGNLRLLTDLSHAVLDEETEVLVECEKNHMPCKGKVKSRNGSVQDIDIHTVVQSFP